MNLNENLNFHYTNADASFTKSGKIINEGEVKERLQLDVGDSRISIAAKKSLDGWWTFSGILQRFTYAEIKFKGERIYVNINSVAKRLHISKKDLKNSEPDRFSTAITLAMENAQQLSQVLTYYAQMPRDDQKNSTLMNTIKSTVAIFLRHNVTLAEFENIVAIKKDESKLELWSLGKKLGSGGYSRVDMITALHKNGRKPRVIKRPKHGPKETSANLDIKKSIDMLQKIHQRGDIPGVQKKQKLREVSYISSNTHKREIGYVSIEDSRYDCGDLSKALKGKLQELPSLYILKLWKDPLAALSRIEDEGICHTDIKLANLLVQTNNNKEEGYNADIADWGGAKDLNGMTRVQNGMRISQKSYSCFDNLLGVHTSAFISLDHMNAGRKAFRRGDVKAVKEILHKMDVFAAGMSIYESVIRESPSSLTKDPVNKRWYVESINFDQSAMYYKEIPTAMKDLLTRMCSTDYTKQPTKKEVSDLYNQIC